MSQTIALRRNEHGEHVLTYEITGAWDIMRWSFHMLSGQCEFGRDARTTLQRLRRMMGHAAFDRLDDYLTGGKLKPYSTRRKESL